MLLHAKVLTLPVTPSAIPEQILDELRQYEGNCKAVYFHVMSLYRRVWKAIQEAKDNGLQISFYFNKFLEGVTESKAEKISQHRMRKVVKVLREVYLRKKQKDRKRQDALNHSKANKLSKVFKEWKCVISRQRLSNVLSKLRLTLLIKEALMLLKQNKERNIINRLSGSAQQMSSNSIHAKYLKILAFKSLFLNLKIAKVENRFRITYFKGLIKSIKDYNSSSKRFNQYRSKRLLNTIFQSWKQNYKESMANRFRRLFILARSFEAWRDNLEYLISERQIEQNNECIISIFTEKKKKEFLSRMLHAWNQQAKQIKYMRHQTNVVNKCAGLQHREKILRRYFEMLKTNCINCKIKSQFYELKLKRKVMEGLKMAICQSLQKEERIISFMEKVERKKYFDRIKRFNQEEEAKVRSFRLNKMFTAFTLSIVYDYYQKSNRAKLYYERNLLFKGLFGFKNEVSFVKKASYCIIYLNAIRPLRRWAQNHRAVHYQQQREWLSLKKIFREWKLLVVRVNSAKKLTRQFSVEDSIKPVHSDESKMEAFEFDNIMATIAKIRKNFVTEKQETLKNESGRWPAVHTPSQEIDFSLSKENLQDDGSP